MVSGARLGWPTCFLSFFLTLAVLLECFELIIRVEGLGRLTQESQDLW